MNNTDVAFPPHCRSCPCDRHDLYLPSIPASLQTLGRCECASACALAPNGLRIISPLTFYLSFLRAIWTFDQKLAPIFSSHLSTITPQSLPEDCQTLQSTCSNFRTKTRRQRPRRDRTSTTLRHFCQLLLMSRSDWYLPSLHCLTGMG